METTSQSGKRRSPIDAARKQSAARTLQPFLDQFGDWNRRAAFIGAARLRGVGVNPHGVLSGLLELEDEVRRSYADFNSTVAGVPLHSRIDDVRMAYDRLLSVLRDQAGN